MMFSKIFIRKANQFRKQNWSAPTIMSVFIVVCMIVVYSFETIGILNKEKNLDFRISTPEKSKIIFNFSVIKTISDVKLHAKPNESKSIITNDSSSEKVVIDQLKNLTKKNREDNLEQMMKILIDGANSQINYIEGVEYDFNSSNAEKDTDDFDFFDI